MVHSENKAGRKMRFSDDAVILGKTPLRMRREGYDEAPESCWCPQCGERRMDWLAWDDDGETLTCATCSKVFTPRS